MEKEQIRKQMLAKRKLLTDEQKTLYSEQIAAKVCSLLPYRERNCVCVYQAFRNEVSCEAVIRQGEADGKRLFVPVTDLKNQTMEFYEFTKETIWHEGAYGIMEPVNPVSRLMEPACILMPGLAFDRRRHRIGYGGGYYDKYLKEHTEHRTAALCYSFQIVEECIPYEAHDWKPDYIITEKEMIGESLNIEQED